MNPYFESGLYTINKNYQLLSFNRVLQRKFPEIKVGAHCYEIFNGSSTPCSHCPVYTKSDRNQVTYFSKKRGYWITATFAETDDPNIITVITTNIKDEVRKQEELHRQELEQINMELQQTLNVNKIFLNAMPPDFVACAIVNLRDGSQKRLLRKGNEITETEVPLLWDDFLRDVINAHMTEPEQIENMQATGQLHMLAKKKPGDVMKFDYFTTYQSTDGSAQPVSTTLAFFEQDDTPYMTIFTTGNIKIEYEKKLKVEVEKLRQQDIEQREALKEALTQAQSANKAKSEFLSNMSHDIRTPMNAIVGFTVLAMSNVNNTERIKDYLNKIDMSSKYLLDLINDVLDMNRIERGMITMEEKKEDLLEILRELNSMLQPLLDKKKITLLFDLKGIQNQAIYCDHLRITQVFINIVGNAVKYSGDGSCVHFQVKQFAGEDEEHANYEFKIKDYGKGITKAFLERIFEPFEREEEHGINKVQGTGLGLAISKNIIDMMGGTITINSEPGAGSEVLVNLPLRLQNSCSVGIEETEEIRLDVPSNMRILLAEDNELNREIAVELLKKYGFLVETAEDGQIAVNKVINSPVNTYDAILMDIQMPNMNGYEASKIIRSLEDEKKAGIPIIAMTANAFVEDKQKALASGMNQHIGKPFDIREVVKVLREVRCC